MLEKNFGILSLHFAQNCLDLPRYSFYLLEFVDSKLVRGAHAFGRFTKRCGRQSTRGEMSVGIVVIPNFETVLKQLPLRGEIKRTGYD